MKKLLFVFFASVFMNATCKHYLTDQDRNDYKFPDNTEISYIIARDMQENLRCDNCRDDGKITINQKLEWKIIEEIKKKNPIRSKKYIQGRYRQEDWDRYKKRHPDTKYDEGDTVNDKATLIVEIVAGKTTFYFDIATICPPPRICDDANAM